LPKLLNIVVVSIRDIDVAFTIQHDAARTDELTIASPQASPAGQEIAVAVKLLDTRRGFFVGDKIRHIHVPLYIHSHIAGAIELIGASAFAAPFPQEVAATVELLYPMIPKVSDVHIALCV